MALDEERLRHSLQANQAEVAGVDETALLMSYLPPVGWADVATKRDVAALATELHSQLIGGSGLNGASGAILPQNVARRARAA